MLKKGDKCHVRLMSGKIIEARYVGGNLDFYPEVYHTVYSDHQYYFPCREKPINKHSCRFVCMTGIRGHNEN